MFMKRFVLAVFFAFVGFTPLQAQQPSTNKPQLCLKTATAAQNIVAMQSYISEITVKLGRTTNHARYGVSVPEREGVRAFVYFGHPQIDGYATQIGVILPGGDRSVFVQDSTGNGVVDDTHNFKSFENNRAALQYFACLKAEIVRRETLRNNWEHM